MYCLQLKTLENPLFGTKKALLSLFDGRARQWAVRDLNLWPPACEQVAYTLLTYCSKSSYKVDMRWQTDDGHLMRGYNAPSANVKTAMQTVINL